MAVLSCSMTLCEEQGQCISVQSIQSQTSAAAATFFFGGFQLLQIQHSMATPWASSAASSRLTALLMSLAVCPCELMRQRPLEQRLLPPLVELLAVGTPLSPAEARPQC